MPATRSSPARQIVVVASFAVVLGALTACTTNTARHTVRIASAVDPNAKFGYAYVLAPEPQGRARTDALHAEVTERVRTALAQRGMYEAIGPAQADVIVYFDYGEHPPQTQVTTVTEPVFVNPGPMGSGIGVNDPWSGRMGVTGRTGPGMSASQSSVVMVETLRVTQTSEKYLRIDAMENTTDKARVWSVDATIEDEGTPIRECIPAMVDAAIEYIGYRTPEPEKVVIKLGPDGPSR